MTLRSRASLMVFVGIAAAWLAGCVDARKETSMATQSDRQRPLEGATVMGFAVVRDGETARKFYEGTLGLKVIEDDPMAIMLSSGEYVIRLQKSAKHQPVNYSVMGWKVADIKATAARLQAAGVHFERYDWMKLQDESGIATFPGGDRVAWFKDPDGNVLSIAQLK